MLKNIFVLFLVLFPFSIMAQTPQEEWIDKLSTCESQDRPAIKVLDINNKYSYGLLQFQLDTFYGFGKQYGFFPEGFTREEARLMIHIPSLQRAIAKEMLDDGLDYHWKNCRDKKLGRYPIPYRQIVLLSP